MVQLLCGSPSPRRHKTSLVENNRPSVNTSKRHNYSTPTLEERKMWWGQTNGYTKILAKILFYAIIYEVLMFPNNSEEEKKWFLKFR